MTVPTITGLPKAPSRISDPDSFGSEALAFLAALPEFVSDFNAYANAINSLTFNFYDWGALDQVASTTFISTFRPIDELPDALNSGMNGRALVENLDAFLFGLKGTTLSTSRGFVSNSNRAGTFFDEISGYCTIAVTDSERTVLIEISDAPTQAQPQSNFIERCLSFFPSVKASADRLSEFEEFLYQKMVADEDWNNVSDDLAFEDYEG
jgi:hypothetical protein